MSDAARSLKSVPWRVGQAFTTTGWGRSDEARSVEPSWGVALPDAGLPRGAVVEIAAHANLGQSTSLALSACARASHDGQWCAWVDPEHTLYAPAVEASDVKLDRLLVVRPPRDDIAKTAVRLAASRLFDVVVVDVSVLPGTGCKPQSLARWANVVRRLSLGVQGSGTTVLLLTDLDVARPLPLPVALRLELQPRWHEGVSVHVAKEKRGRTTTAPRTVVWARPWHDLLISPRQGAEASMRAPLAHTRPARSRSA